MSLYVVLMTTHCPRCNVLKKKLEQRSISFEEVEGEKAVESMIAMEFSSAPVLIVDDEVMDYEKATNWLQNYKNEEEGN